MKPEDTQRNGGNSFPEILGQRILDSDEVDLTATTTTTSQKEAPLFGCAGDLVIEFGAGVPSIGRQSQVLWTNSVTGSTWAMWQKCSGMGWRGSPMLHVKRPSWQIWLLGELYGAKNATDEEQQRLSEMVGGERSASELNGHLLLLAWDEAQREWHIWTDRFGTFHVYHAHHGKVAALGTCFQTVAQLASGRQLDWQALTGFFGFGFFPQDRTFYDDVRILRPATHYVFDATGNELSATRYWEWRHEPDSKRSYDETVAEFGSIFETVMSEMLGGKGPRETKGEQSAEGRGREAAISRPTSRIAIPISGGLDSRCTVAEVKSRKQRAESGNQSSDSVWSYSYGYADDSVETRIARQVAAARGLPFTPLTIKPYLFDHLEQILGAVEGFQDITQCRQAFVADELRQHADYVIAAHWGDVWLDDMGLVGKGPKDARTKGRKDQGTTRNLSGPLVVEHALSKMAKKGRAWLLENLCVPHLGTEKPEEMLRQYVADGMKPLEHIEDPDFRVKAFKTDNWSFRWTLASIRMFQAAAFPRLPFYDTRLADFFCTVPSEFVKGRRLQVDYLKRFAPDLARVKWQVYDANLFSYHRFNTWHLPKRALKKSLRVLKGDRVLERNWEVQFAGEKGEAGLGHWLLRPGLRLHELVAREQVERLLEDFSTDPLKDGRGYTVSMLLTFSVWLEGQSGSLERRNSGS